MPGRAGPGRWWAEYEKAANAAMKVQMKAPRLGAFRPVYAGLRNILHRASGVRTEGEGQRDGPWEGGGERVIQVSRDSDGRWAACLWRRRARRGGPRKGLPLSARLGSDSFTIAGRHHRGAFRRCGDVVAASKSDPEEPARGPRRSLRPATTPPPSLPRSRAPRAPSLRNVQLD
jgi:hypothetical protein